ncbi:MAG: phosphotransferase [Alphaproteobacteria bacterium]|nr:phosphotransferase [Alphaproteobacteria bacterium]
MEKYLQNNPKATDVLTAASGKTLAQINKIKVAGFGPFDNEIAKTGKVQGLHDSFLGAVRAGLEFNLDVLKGYDVLNAAQSAGINELFGPDNKLLRADAAVLVHNDMPAWNALTIDGIHVSAALDWDECVGGIPVSEIACYSTFYEPERMEKFLEGYFSVSGEIPNFKEQFELMRLRYIVSKMTLRLRRYFAWQKDDFMKQKIETGKIHLKESLKHFGLSK